MSSWCAATPEFLPKEFSGKNRAAGDAKPVMTLVNAPGAPVAGAVADRHPASLRYLVTVVCAGSAGVHAMLVPEHLRESTPLGMAFAASAVALALAALAARAPRNDAWAPAGAAAVLVAVAVAYVASRSTGIPALLPAREAVDPLGVLTTSAEAVAAAGALLLHHRRDVR